MRYGSAPRIYHTRYQYRTWRSAGVVRPGCYSSPRPPGSSTAWVSTGHRIGSMAVVSTAQRIGSVTYVRTRRLIYAQPMRAPNIA
eukprot:189377-Rhodomonas_salina.2